MEALRWSVTVAVGVAAVFWLGRETRFTYVAWRDGDPWTGQPMRGYAIFFVLLMLVGVWGPAGLLLWWWTGDLLWGVVGMVGALAIVLMYPGP